MAIIMPIILRAVTFGFLSSFSIWCGTWQYSHSTPREAAMNCMAGMTCSAGIPLSAWIFLYSSSASLGATPPCGEAFGGADCPRAPATTSKASNEVPQTESRPFQTHEFIDSTSRRLWDENACEVVAASAKDAAFLCADFTAFGKRGNVVGRAESERHDGHGGLAASGGHQAAAVTQEKVLHIVCAMVCIDHRCLRIIAHAAGAEQVHAKLLLLRGETPLLNGARGLMDRVGALEEPIREFQIIGMVFVGQPKSGQSPSVFQIRIERERVVFEIGRA